MEHLRGAPLVFLCIVVVAVSLHACGIAVWLIPKMEQALQTLRGFWVRSEEQTAPTSVKKTPVKDVALQLVLDGRVRERRVTYARRYLLYLNILDAAMLIVIVVNMILARPRWFSPTQDYVVVATYLCGLIVYYFVDFQHKKLGRQSDGVIYALFLLHHLGGIALVAGADDDYVLQTVLGVCPILLGGSAAMMQPKLIAVIAVGYVVTTSIRLDNAAFLISWGLELTLHLYILASSIGVTYMTRMWTLIEVHQTVAAHNWRTERLAAEGLLDLLCDCVLELDNELCIVTESAKFASMVLVREAGTLVGRGLDEFLLESSRSTLSNVQRRVDAQETCAGAMNMQLLDAMRNLITVEMFYIRFSDSAASQARYFVGLREYGDVSRIIRESPGTGFRNTISQAGLSAGVSMPCHSELSSTPTVLQPISEVALQFTSNPSREEQAVGPEQPCVRTGDVDATRVHDIIMRLTNDKGQKQPPKYRLCSDSSTAAGTCYTKPDAMEAMVMQLMRSWSAAGDVPLGYDCCAYHTALAVVKTVVQKQESKPCIPSFARIDKMQCKDCGVLAEQVPADNECLICNMCKPSDLPPPAAKASSKALATESSESGWASASANGDSVIITGSLAL
eukprot:TRINITY_DN23276_c0_g2_i5.p1 TRINITY_DN23276_c0_g2~~TRINITY_DN23276_c0_g2_i5.p1  ORF type:complete len:621 (+),score=45.61 TRINITY_DN23276_c0_g2_i5:117-1979(+)